MARRNAFTRSLAVAGTVLVWLPILAPFFLSAARLIAHKMFRLDYLMPAELFPVVMVGGGALLWAALRVRARRSLIGWGLAASVGLLAAGQWLAVVTGLASGETEAAGWPWILVLASLAAYSAAIVVIGIGGLLLIGDLLKAEANRAARV